MASEPGFRLIVRKGPQPNQVYQLTRDVVTIGRDITNDIVVNDPEVSRHHTRLNIVAGAYAVEDLGSTNGTFVNGQRLVGAGSKKLEVGDLVGIGETVTLAYEATSIPVQKSRTTMAGDPPPPAPSPPAKPPAQTAPLGESETAAEVSFWQENRRPILIGCAVATSLGCCIVAALVALVLSGVVCVPALVGCL